MNISPVNLPEILKPIAETIDNLHTSAEEKTNAKRQLVELETKLQTTMLQMSQQTYMAELQSDSIFAKNWRPAVSVALFGLVAWQILSTGEVVASLENLALFFWGYTGVGRSVEKTARGIGGALRDRYTTPQQDRQIFKLERKRQKMAARLLKKKNRTAAEEELLNELLEDEE